MDKRIVQNLFGFWKEHLLSLVMVYILISCLSFKGFSQTEKSRKLSVQVYTGGPSLLKWAFKFSSQYQDKITYAGLPGFGGEVNYRFNRWVSASADLYYRYGRLEMNVDDLSFYNELRDKWGIEYDGLNPLGSYRLELPRYKGTLNVFVHALKEESPSDFYLSLGFGYNKLKARLYKDDEELDFTESIGTISLPIAYRFAAGFAYDFAPMIGLFTEVGIGGPVFSFGVNARF